MSAIDFTGPQGAAGADGADGADGAAGPPGTGRYVMQVLVSDPAEDLTAGTGKRYLAIPFALDGKVLVAVQAHLVTAASAGLTSVQIHNVTDAVNVLSTVCSIDATHKDSKTATTAAVINTANDDMADGDELRIDVPAAGSGAKGLVVSLSFEGASGVSGTGGGMFDAYAYLRDEKPANTAGGAATTGSWQTRTLNTEVIDTNAIVALSANQFTLGAGIYVIRARAPFFRTQRSKIKLRNVSDSTDDIIGTNVYSETAAAGDSVECDLFGRIVLAGPKTFALQYQVDANDGGNANTLGIAGDHGVIEVYAEVEIWREGSVDGGGGGGLFDAHALLRDERTSGTGGGSCSAGTWNTRPLNTEVDPSGIVSLDTGTNRFTLAAGTYRITASAPHLPPSSANASHKLRLRNITDATTDIVGTSEFAYNAQTTAHLQGRIQIAAAKVFELQHYTENARATNGLGIALSIASVAEVFALVQIERETA